MITLFRNTIKSLRFRIFICILIFAAAPSIALRAGIVYSYRNSIVNSRIDDMVTQANLLASQIVRYGYLNQSSGSDEDDGDTDALNSQIEQLGSVFDVRVIVLNASYQAVVDTYDRVQGKTAFTEEVMTASNDNKTVRHYSRKNHSIVIAVPISRSVDQTGRAVTGGTSGTSASDSGNTTQYYGTILLTGTDDFLQENIDSFRQWSLIILLITYTVVVILGVLISNRLVRPLHKLAGSINDVKEGYASDFTGVHTYTEVSDISDACKDMLERLKQLDESRQEFVSNVSHELKTPLTSMKVLADSLNGADNVPNELYKEFMSDITNEIDRENKIINDLLELVRLDKSAGELNIEHVNMNDMLGLLMKRLKPIAEKKDVELVLESFRPVTADVDEVKMTLALSNLIENAIKYNKEGGFVHVSLNADHQNAYVTVIDNGIGIPEESQAHIFERFYRVDKSHSRAIGGTGLGLAITRNVIIMHRGAIRVHSVEGEGTTFQVKVPLVYVSNADQ